MEKIIKRIMNILFALVFSVAFALAALPSAFLQPKGTVTVSAEDATDANANKADLTDKNAMYYFPEGAAIYKPDSIKGLGFQLFLQNVDAACLVDRAEEYMLSIFTLYRTSSTLNNTAVPIYQIIVLTVTAATVDPGVSGAITLFIHKPLNTDEGVDVYEPSNIFLDQRDASSCSDFYDSTSGNELRFFNKIKKLVSEADLGVLDSVACYDSFDSVEHLRFKTNGNVPYVRFTCNLDSPNLEYYVDYKYYFCEYSRTSTNFWGEKTDHFKETVGHISSSTRSVFNVLNNIYEKGGEALLEQELVLPEIYEEGLAILKNNYVEEIKVQYLEPIADLPFAKMVTKTISVPVLTRGDDAKVFHDDICDALGLKSLSLLGSNWSGSTLTNVDGQYVWRASYFEAVYLTARTTDGNTTDAGSQASTKYFLDLNKSYHDYYDEFVKDGVFTSEVYEYYFNDLVNSCSQLAGIQPEELHGYWGFVGIPTTNSFNTLWAEMFDVETSTAEIFKSFDYDATITYEAYDSLLTEYGYRWWEKAWNNVANFATGTPAEASIYFFCANPVAEVGILESGAADIDDDRGTVIIEVEKVATEILDGLPNFMEETQAKIEQTIKTIVAVVLVVALVAGGIYLSIVLKKQ